MSEEDYFGDDEDAATCFCCDEPVDEYGGDATDCYDCGNLVHMHCTQPNFMMEDVCLLCIGAAVLKRREAKQHSGVQ